jgi:mono/diheme cytochrome c family protein
MKRIRIGAAGVVVLAAFLCAMPANAAPAPAATDQAASLAAGQDLVRRNCGMCHAIGRDGQSPNPQAPLFRELHRRYSVDDLAEALAEGIITGHPAMPEFRFEPSELNAIIRYLKSIQTDQRASVS